MRPAPSAPVELGIFGSRGLALTCLGMDRSYCQRTLQEAEAELDAARARTQVPRFALGGRFLDDLFGLVDLEARLFQVRQGPLG